MTLYTKWNDITAVSTIINSDTAILSGSKRSTVMDITRIVRPSGDETGVTDSAAIVAAINVDGFVQLVAGTYYISEPIILNSNYESLIGIGNKTIIEPVNDTFVAVKISGESNNCAVSGVRITGGLYGIEIDFAKRWVISNVMIESAASHGIYVHGNAWICRIENSQIQDCGGDGINSLSDATYSNGNALSLVGVSVENNTGHGLTWSASGLCVVGCTFESNSDSALHILSDAYVATGINISGNYFEADAVAEIELETASSDMHAIAITGNYSHADDAVPSVLISTTATGNVKHCVVDESNRWTGSSLTTPFVIGAVAKNCDIYLNEIADSDAATTNYTGVRYRNELRQVCARFNIDVGGEYTDKQTPIMTLPAHSIIHDIIVSSDHQMTGTTTTKFEIGSAANPDKFIDSLDWDPSINNNSFAMSKGTNQDEVAPYYYRATYDITATWTNTGGVPDGDIEVFIIYTPGPVTAEVLAIP